MPYTWTLLGACVLLLPLPSLGRPHPPKRERPGKALAAQPPATASDAQSLLRLMLQAEKSLSLSGSQTTTISRGGREVTSEQRVMRNGSRALRLEYIRPANLAGEQIVDDGHLFRRYIPATNTLEVSPSRIQRLGGRMRQVMEQIARSELSVQTVGQAAIAGRACRIIEVTPKGASKTGRRRFWIDPTNGAQLRIDQFNVNGQRVSTSYYTDIAYNPTFAPDAFRAPKTPDTVRTLTPQVGTPLPSVAQAQAQAGFTVLQPSYLPPGFRFQSASLSDYRKRKLVALRYVNGLNVFSLFETPRPTNARPETSKRPRHPRNGVLTAEQGDLRLVLIGNLSSDDMERVLASVR
ncbi:MAG: hypothetical protein M3Y28_03125 [Armatimonadota bacterium]|nr:hypothetical protein [Armatimonadota bacterium]